MRGREGERGRVRGREGERGRVRGREGEKERVRGREGLKREWKHEREKKKKIEIETMSRVTMGRNRFFEVSKDLSRDRHMGRLREAI